MTTSSKGDGKGARDMALDLDRLNSQAAAATGMPDPAVLARMAAEYFGSLPAHDPTGIARNAGDLGYNSMNSPKVISSQADLQKMGQPVIPSVPVSPALPGSNAGPRSFDPAFGPAFSFLQEARSLYASPPATPVQAVAVSPTAVPTTPNAIQSATALPGTTEAAAATDESNRFISAIAGQVPTAESNPYTPSLTKYAVPKVTGAPTDTAMPSMPGAVELSAFLDRSTHFDFLELLNPLEPVNVVPTVVPVATDFPAPTFDTGTTGLFDVNAVRRDFPILQEKINGRQLIWLDNAATTQKPQAVIDRISYFYQHENSNVHRAAHTLAARSTDAYEAARETVRRFLNASSAKEIIFVRGATEAINLVAWSWGKRNIQKDDEIVITWLEHHANIVPWQMLCAEKGAKLRVAPVDNTGQVLLDEYEKLFNSRTKLAAITHVSNALGTVTPVAEMTEIAHRHGAKVLVDGAQAVSHMPVDVQSYDCDFYVFSGHKVFAPTGIGVVYGKSDVLDQTPPWQGGGNMIADVTFEKILYQPPPGRFEAGTGNIADAVGLGAALDYVTRIGMNNIARVEHDLLVYGTQALQRIPGLHLIGTANDKASVLSFVLDGYRTEDVGAALAREGIAVRAGHHCAQPILRRFGLNSTVRPSLAFYNTCEEIDALVAALWNLKSNRMVSVV